MPKFKGIDVSKHDGKINWSKVKNDGIDFVIIRAGYGSSTIDERFKENIEGAIKVGLDIGIYWFSYAINEQKAKEEAIKCMEVVSPYKSHINYPIFYDLEYDTISYAKKQGVNINKTKASAFAEAFLKEIKKGGYRAGLYSNIDYSKNYFFKSVQREYDMWIAQYASRCTYSEPHVMWQYSEKGRVSGINANVDLNYSYKKYSKNDSNKEESPKKEETPKVDNPKDNGKVEGLVKELQTALNNSYNTTLVIDGVYGDKTKAVVKENPLTIDKVNKKLEHTMWLQKALKELGYNITVDGYFGKDTKDIVKKYQQDKNLQVDGMAGIETHNSIISYK